MRLEDLSEEQLVSLHIAGATVRHQNPFLALPTFRNETPLSKAMMEKWVRPFYMRHMHQSEVQDSGFVLACAEATPEIAASLLGEFDWRPRTVGARLVAVRQFFELQKEVSNLLLKSEVCYVGGDYCLALASLGNEAAADTLSTYLDYYLRQPDLWFDQGQAMAALTYLDESLGSSKAAGFSEAWQQFISNKPSWKLDSFNKLLRSSVAVTQGIRQLVAPTT